MFDSADIYSDGMAEEILGQAIKGRRDQVLDLDQGHASAAGPGPNDVGSSRHHLIRAVEASLRRLGTDYIDLYQLHGFDALTPVEEVLGTLDDLVRAGKIRYIGCSNFSGWHLMKSLAVSEKYGLARYVAHQAYYSLVGRDYEWELMPLALDQKVGAVVWSPLGWGRLTGKIRRGQPLPQTSRLQNKLAIDIGPQVPDEYRLSSVVDALDAVAKETGKTRAADRAQLAAAAADGGDASSIGARNEEQLRQNLGAVGWNLTPEQIAKLDAASAMPLAYPYWHQRRHSFRPQPAAGVTMSTTQNEKAVRFRASASGPARIRHRQSLGRRLGAHPRRARLPGAGDFERRFRRHPRPARRQGDARRGAGAMPAPSSRRPTFPCRPIWRRASATRRRPPRRRSALPPRPGWSAARSRTRPATRTSRSTTSATPSSASRQRCRRRARCPSRSR